MFSYCSSINVAQCSILVRFGLRWRKRGADSRSVGARARYRASPSFARLVIRNLLRSQIANANPSVFVGFACGRVWEGAEGVSWALGKSWIVRVEGGGWSWCDQSFTQPGLSSFFRVARLAGNGWPWPGGGPAGAHFQRYRWQFASWRSSAPTLIWGGAPSGPLRGRVWLANVDAVLDEQWLELAQARVENITCFIMVSGLSRPGRL